MQTIKFFTLGCKVNQYDTQLLREQILSNSDFKELNNSHFPADVYIINTCTVTNSADRESIKLIRKAKKENPSALIIVTGCLAELDQDRIKKEAVDLIVKNIDKPKIKELLGLNDLNMVKGITYFKGHIRAFLKIQEGCNNFCSYCKIPLVRGPARSKKPELIIEEFTNLLKNGYREIVLSGVSLGSFGKDLEPKMELIELLELLDNLEGDFRIRLSSIETWDITESFINKIAKIRKLCPHLHIPIQSGDEEILKLMNRPITPQEYLEKIENLRKKINFLTITTDILVGFPGERKENFLNTINLIEKIKPLRVHIFSFSPRLYTKAYLLKEKVNTNEIKARVIFLKKLAENIAWQIKSDFLKKEMRVLFESPFNKNEEVWWKGFTDNYIKVKVKTNQNLRNKFLPVKLEAIDNDYILASI